MHRRLFLAARLYRGVRNALFVHHGTFTLILVHLYPWLGPHPHTYQDAASDGSSVVDVRYETYTMPICSLAFLLRRQHLFMSSPTTASAPPTATATYLQYIHDSRPILIHTALTYRADLSVLFLPSLHEHVLAHPHVATCLHHGTATIAKHTSALLMRTRCAVYAVSPLAPTTPLPT